MNCVACRTFYEQGSKQCMCLTVAVIDHLLKHYGLAIYVFS
jgi:hypothetical protein